MGADGEDGMGAAAGGDLLDLLERAVGSVCGAEVDMLDEPGLTGWLDRVQHAQARLAAERARLIAVLEQRRTVTIEDPSQQQRERQQLRRDLANRSNRAPAATKLDAQAGLAAAEHTATGRAFADGRIDAEHVRLIAEALDVIIDRGERETVERDLLEIAGRVQPSVLGRHVRELLARYAPVSVTLREERQHRDRRVNLVDTPDGGLSLSGLVYGTAAETVRTALDAFRRPDLSGELRTPAQRTADALEQLCATALRAGEAPTRHGIRPQVLITVTTDQLDLGDDGLALLASAEPTTLGRLRHLLDDCSWARVVLGPDSTPIEASENVRTVPQGLWRALIARDQGCTWPDCDAPPAWCDVAHGTHPFAAGGRLTPDNAALLCRRHHRRFDHGNYNIHINGNHVTYQRTREDGSSPATPEPPPRPDQPAGPPSHQQDTAHQPDPPPPGQEPGNQPDPPPPGEDDQPPPDSSSGSPGATVPRPRPPVSRPRGRPRGQPRDRPPAGSLPPSPGHDVAQPGLLDDLGP